MNIAGGHENPKGWGKIIDKDFLTIIGHWFIIYSWIEKILKGGGKGMDLPKRS
jgi:hypothetical protein